MKTLSLDLRQRIVDAYLSGRSGTYKETALLFDVSESSVGRLLLLHRQTGELKPKQRGGYRKAKVDEQWLLQHVAEFPQARLTDRVQAYQEHSQITVHPSTMSYAMKRVNQTYKKNTSRKRTST